MCVAVFPKCHALRKNNEKNLSCFNFIIHQHAKLSISNIILPKQKAENLRHNSIFVILFQTAAKGGFSCQTQARTSMSAGMGAGRDGISAEENRMAAHDIFPSISKHDTLGNLRRRYFLFYLYFIMFYCR